MSRRLRAALAAVVLGVASGATRAAAVEPRVEVLLRGWTSFWQTFEEGSFRGPRGVFYDRRRDEVWVADTQNDRLAIFTPDGMPLYSVAPGREVSEPARLAVDAAGDVLVLDSDRSRLARLDWRGRYLGPLELPGLPPKPRIGAFELDDEGNLYLGENSAGEVIVYGPDRRVRHRFGRRGTGRGEFVSIADIAVGAERVAVIDHQATAVQIFDRHGNFEHGFGEHQMGAENFSLPEAAVFDPRGRLVVVDALRHEIKLFTVEGRFLGRFGGRGREPGQVAGPVDVASDGKGWLYVAERNGHRVQVFEIRERSVLAGERGAAARRVRP